MEEVLPEFFLPGLAGDLPRPLFSLLLEEADGPPDQVYISPQLRQAPLVVRRLELGTRHEALFLEFEHRASTAILYALPMTPPVRRNLEVLGQNLVHTDEGLEGGEDLAGDNKGTNSTFLHPHAHDPLQGVVDVPRPNRREDVLVPSELIELLPCLDDASHPIHELRAGARNSVNLQAGALRSPWQQAASHERQRSNDSTSMKT
mmetsp:Transcript_99012/g.284492  ORF Transcript_99012/g.284492 Transcript_99012/m.284492 type:complete len:204 (-) Transcript_99012:4-615(-)